LSFKYLLPKSQLSTILLLPALVLFASAAFGLDGSGTQVQWVGSWSASQQLVEPENALSPADLRDATLRQIVHLSLRGAEIRLRLSNRFGTTPLHLTAVHVARPLSPAADKITPGTDKTLTFSGSPEVTIPAHSDYLSDPILFPVDPLSDLAITLHADVPPLEQTGHPGSRATSYITHGDYVSALDLPGYKTVEHWYFIAEIDVASQPGDRAIVVLGDSISDGHGATTNGNNRWPDILAQRLAIEPRTRNVSVLNQGIGGNRLLRDGLGPNALARFDDDVIAPAGTRYLIVLEGVNDIGMLAREGEVSRAEHDLLVQRMIGVYEQIIARAHTHDIKVIGATIMPFTESKFYHPGPPNEADRQAVNQWIRSPGHFDALIDFDKITRDPEHPERLLPAFDSGDHLHPSPTGYAAMANSVPLSLFGSSSDPAPKIAITFDDLPAHCQLPSGETRIGVISKIVEETRREKDRNFAYSSAIAAKARLSHRRFSAERGERISSGRLSTDSARGKRFRSSFMGPNLAACCALTKTERHAVPGTMARRVVCTGPPCGHV
jgi:lysophospholipase L1-like esterase